MTNEIISIWKPSNITSYDVIRRIKTIVKNTKIGHCGTLDPFAEGVLVICFGSSTKKINEILNETKKYKAEIILGSETDTLDLDGQIIRQKENITISKETIIEKLSAFIGEINQIPPYFSAKKINGVRMYKLARNDIFIKRKGCKVIIEDISFISLNDNVLTINVTCSKGTYIRSLARDIAYSLNTYGYLNKLERFQVGNFVKDNSIKFEDLHNCLN